MKTAWRIGLLLVPLVAILACGTPGDGARSSTGVLSPAEPGSTTQAASATAARASLPPGFPLMAHASAVPVPADTAVIARWRVPVVGSAAYDFYRRALPKAGLSIVGLYPADRAALIRFRDRSGAVWQLQAELYGDETQVTVQTDRP